MLTVKPEQVKGRINRLLASSQQIVELRPAFRVYANDFPIEYGFMARKGMR
jgi:hypothetical protein